VRWRAQGAFGASFCRGRGVSTEFQADRIRKTALRSRRIRDGDNLEITSRLKCAAESAGYDRVRDVDRS
jgi:hypothetical protein